VHFRRALLLFAIVLGLAALAASVSRPRDESSDTPVPPSTEREPPTLEPGPVDGAGSPATVTLDAASRERVRVEPGEPVTLEVEVDEAGLVEIPAFGLSAPGQPLTPARFEILTRDAGRYVVRFTPAEGDGSEPAGRLVVKEPES
jgi:hypothetical protein